MSEAGNQITADSERLAAEIDWRHIMTDLKLARFSLSRLTRTNLLELPGLDDGSECVASFTSLKTGQTPPRWDAEEEAIVAERTISGIAQATFVRLGIGEPAVFQLRGVGWQLPGDKLQKKVP